MRVRKGVVARESGFVDGPWMDVLDVFQGSRDASRDEEKMGQKRKKDAAVGLQ